MEEETAGEEVDPGLEKDTEDQDPQILGTETETETDSIAIEALERVQISGTTQERGLPTIVEMRNIDIEHHQNMKDQSLLR